MNPFQETVSSNIKTYSYNEYQDNVLLQQLSPAPPIPNTNLTGVYSNTGFDMIQILSRLIHR